MNIVRFPFPDELDSYEASFDDDDMPSAEAISAHLAELATPALIWDQPPRERFRTGIIVMIGAAVAAVGITAAMLLVF